MSAELKPCPVCDELFEAGHGKRYCCTKCRWEATNNGLATPKPHTAIIQRHGDGVRFIFAPIIDGDNWPVGCSFPLTEIELTLRLGNFPNGSRFRYQGLVYTVRGRQAIGPGERIIK